MVGRRETGWRGQERTREHSRRVGLPGDEARVRWVTERVDLTAYTVQYEPWIDGLHRPAARYDSAHGHPHLDLLGWDGEVVDKEWLAPEPLEVAFTSALNHLRANWRRLREDFVNRRPR